MNANQIINMIMRVIMRKAINKGVDAGISGAAKLAQRRKGAPEAPQGEWIDDHGNVQPAAQTQAEQERAERQQKRAARQAIRAARRASRMQ